MSKVIIDTDTGEILDEIRAGDKFKITREKSIRYLRSVGITPDGNVNIRKNRKYYFCLEDGFNMLCEVLSGNEIVFFMRMIKYLEYNTGKLSYSNGRKITPSKLVDAIGVPKSSVYRLLNKLSSKNVIKVVESDGKSVIYINPFVCFKGSYIKESLYNMFKDTDFNTYKINEIKLYDFDRK